MEKRNKLSDIGCIGSDGCAASVLAVKNVKECCQSLFQCHGVHIRSCRSHVSPTFSYRPKTDQSDTPGKSDSDNMLFFPLYGTASIGCQGGDAEGWFREAGLSEPMAGLKDCT